MYPATTSARNSVLLLLIFPCDFVVQLFVSATNCATLDWLQPSKRVINRPMSLAAFLHCALSRRSWSPERRLRTLRIVSDSILSPVGFFAYSDRRQTLQHSRPHAPKTMPANP